MKAYHEAWLAAHPERDAVWLQERLADGFDVHHLDGDKSNNGPTNLVLIEHRDHFMLHSGGRPAARTSSPRGPHRKTLRRGKLALMHRQRYLYWREVALLLDCTRAQAMSSAKAYLEHCRKG